ncbi:MAG: ATP-binding protein, partial [Myxococcales bacterium]|nr:ATP-binding protein [Myxococcales bacterium]
MDPGDPMTEPVLHGRRQPLSALRAALASAREGRGRLVLVSGDAGIGKTSLVTALADEAAAAGATVSTGRAWELADAPPYFPVWPCLRSLGVTPSEDEQAFRLWETVLEALARAAATRPVVWVVEDLHAADLGTL